MTLHPTHATEYLEFPASSLRETTGAGVSSSTPAPVPHSIPAGAATTHHPARREPVAEGPIQHAMLTICRATSAILIGAMAMFAYFVAAKAGANIAAAFFDAGF